MIFFDAYAILEIIKGNKNYEKYFNTIFITNTLHLSEVFYSLIRECSLETANEIINNLDFEFIEINDKIAIESVIFKYNNKTKIFLTQIVLVICVLLKII